MNLPLAFIQQIDALLPQTQCGLCGHRDGCLPYAKAIAEGEAANKCVPGGQPVADALAQLLKRPVLPAEPSVWPIQADGRPQRMKAVIREEECIGCTKCISACPVDAIVGSGKVMHSIFTDLCTGCELCIPPCPVDCIDLVEDHTALATAAQRIAEQNHLRDRYYAHIQRDSIKRSRLKGPILRAAIDHDVFVQFDVIADETTPTVATHSTHLNTSAPSPVQSAQTTIELAKIRSKIKKLEKQLSVRPDANKQIELTQLRDQLQQIQEAC
ncbi:RnfABCDGE type electron transport complex subunit B [Acinetobacter larvae]|uniref:Iron-sulfur protein n=1 Tax=Acinetobacter larvae TaxID=1789224 RepID=A0A1B2LXY6_9GAMM|nr:RnfABCDGE type electron transport complex subunit B [Acinetobacter larvae]AOA57807.1 iron-sulfur protein [Acinetobacter larvae]